MVVIANRVIEQDSLDRIRRLIGMTKLGQMLEDEKKQYGDGRAEEAERQMAKRMLFDGIAPETILKYSTFLSRQDIEKLLNAASV